MCVLTAAAPPFPSLAPGLPCFSQNYARADDKIAQHQDKDSSYTLAHNAFSHM